MQIKMSHYLVKIGICCMNHPNDSSDRKILSGFDCVNLWRKLRRDVIHVQDSNPDDREGGQRCFLTPVHSSNCQIIILLCFAVKHFWNDQEPGVRVELEIFGVSVEVVLDSAVQTEVRVCGVERDDWGADRSVFGEEEGEGRLDEDGRVVVGIVHHDTHDGRGRFLRRALKKDLLHIVLRFNHTYMASLVGNSRANKDHWLRE